MLRARIEETDGETVTTVATLELQEEGPRVGPPTGHKGETTFAHAGQEWVVSVRVRKATPKGPCKQARSWEL